MTRMERRFARLLSEGIYRIRLRESKTVQIIQDELGYALGRDGGSAIHYWRKGHIPAQQADIEKLARELVKRGALGPNWLDNFLESADYPQRTELCATLFPQARRAPDQIPDGALAPFIAGPPISHPAHFFGRERELKRIFGLLKRFPLQNVAITGPYRSGKTSLLHYLKNITRTPVEQLRSGQQADWLPEPERYQWVFVDFQDVRMGRRETLLGYLLDCLEMPRPVPCDLPGFMQVVSSRLQRPSVILMDEIGAAMAAPELDQQFWWSLRSLGSNQTGGKLAFILTSPVPPSQLAQEHGKPSPFFNIFGHTLQLGPLTDAEARALLARSPIPFPAADVDWILAQSGRWPCLLQILSHNRWVSLDEGEADDAWQAEAQGQIEPYRHLLQPAK